MKIINLNKTLGIIGAGQLGKMIGLAAANLGIKVCFYDPDPNAPAKSISNFFYNEKYTNKKKISEFSKKCDFVFLNHSVRDFFVNFLTSKALIDL